jgi:hypothetical protein
MTIISRMAQMARRSMDVQLTGSRNGVDAARIERVAAGEAAQGQP